MSLTRKDKRREPAEFASGLAKPTQSQPELRKRLLGDKVRQARRSAGLTQLEPARTLRIALSKLSRYERGLDTIPPRLLLTSIVLGLAAGRKALTGRPEVVTATKLGPSREEDTRTSAPCAGWSLMMRRGSAGSSGAVSGREGGS
jgi:hypothetical protein